MLCSVLFIYLQRINFVLQESQTVQLDVACRFVGISIKISLVTETFCICLNFLCVLKFQTFTGAELKDSIIML